MGKELIVLLRPKVLKFTLKVKTPIDKISSHFNQSKIQKNSNQTFKFLKNKLKNSNPCRF